MLKNTDMLLYTIFKYMHYNSTRMILSIRASGYNTEYGLAGSKEPGKPQRLGGVWESYPLHVRVVPQSGDERRLSQSNERPGRQEKSGTGTAN